MWVSFRFFLWVIESNSILTHYQIDNTKMYQNQHFSQYYTIIIELSLNNLSMIRLFFSVFNHVRGNWPATITKWVRIAYFCRKVCGRWLLIRFEQVAYVLITVMNVFVDWGWEYHQNQSYFRYHRGCFPPCTHDCFLIAWEYLKPNNIVEETEYFLFSPVKDDYHQFSSRCIVSFLSYRRYKWWESAMLWFLVPLLWDIRVSLG